LDDLIVGVDQAYVNGKQRVGKSYVIFGKIDSTAINQSRHKIYLRLVYRLDWLYEHQQSNHPSHRR
jgi:hypothetical protein